MGYHKAHASPSLGASPDGRRAPGPGGRPALGSGLHPAACPRPAGERPRRARPGHRPDARLRRADRPRRHPRVQPAGTRRADPGLLASPRGPCRLRRGRGRAAQGPVAPRPARVRPPDQPVDARSGGRDRARRRADRDPGPGRGGAGHPGATRRPVGAGQAPDHRPRPGARTGKSARGRPIPPARPHPARAPGLAGGVRRSRVAQPAGRAWPAAGTPLRVADRAVAREEGRAPAC